MYKKLFSETLIFGIGAILPRIINYLLNPYYINEINPDEYAYFINLYAIISFVNILLTFGFETAFFRFSNNKADINKVYSTAFWFLALNAAIFLILVLIFQTPIANFFDYSANPEYIKWFGWIAFFDTLLVIPFAWLRYQNKPIHYSVIRVSQSIVQTLAILSFFLWIPKDFLLSMGLYQKVAYPFFGNVIGSVLGFVLLIPIILKVRSIFDFELFKKMLSYSWPIMLAGLAFMVNENLDKALQRFMISDAQAGAYGGCYKLAVLMTLFVTAYRLGVEPFLFKQMNEKDAKKTYAQLTEYFVIAVSVVALALITNLEWLVSLFIKDKSYWIALDIIPIIVIANLFFGVYYNLSTWYKVSDKTYVGTYISWFGAGLTIAINLIGIPIFGFMASAWATLFAYFSMTIISYIWGQKVYHIPYKRNKITLYIGICILFSGLSYLIFDSNIFIGNALLLSFATIIYLIEVKSNTILSKYK